MSHRPFTAPWAEALREAINGSAVYRAAASNWRWPIALVLEREPSLGYDEDRALLLELEGGVCRRAELVEPSRLEAPFVIAGAYGTWKEIVRGALDPVSALMKKRVRLSGSLATLLANIGAARALVACAAAVPTVFPDEEG